MFRKAETQIIISIGTQNLLKKLIKFTILYNFELKSGCDDNNLADNDSS